MPEIKILEYNKEAQEAVAEIVTSICEEMHLSQVSLRVYCQPISSPEISGKISLSAFLVKDIFSENTLQAPQKTDWGYFSYRLFAKVIDARNRRVQLGDIDIELDCPLPKDIPDNSCISFDVGRLDLQISTGRETRPLR